MESTDSKELSSKFEKHFEEAIAIRGNGLASITTGLFWIRPKIFMPLDSKSRSYIPSRYKIDTPQDRCSGEEYLLFLSNLNDALEQEEPLLSFPELSHQAWLEEEIISKQKKEETDEQVESSLEEKENQKIVKKQKKEESEKNFILYGPPGTGKTYNLARYAVAIVEEKTFSEIKDENYDVVFKRYEKYIDDGFVALTTFHQSFSYEEFIEGIRPIVFSEDETESTSEIEYEIHDGIFKGFCDKAAAPIDEGKDSDLGIGKSPNVWKVSLEGTGDNPTRRECLRNGHIRIGWDNYGEVITDATNYSKEGGKAVLNAFYNRMQNGDIIISCYSSKTIDAIGVVTGEPEWHDEYSHYKRLRKVNWLVKNIEVDIVDINAGKQMTLSTIYKLSVTLSDVLKILREKNKDLFKSNIKIPNRIFIIDEINRGNISKIFGELISLIEPSKRLNAKEGMSVILPYSKKQFGVPDNVYIIGTMNTADRSIAMIDTALRRRFSFIEMQAEPKLLENVVVEGMTEGVIKKVDIAQMLDTINKRITVLLDREHTIGHSYLLPLRDDPSLEKLSGIFENKIIPLLQEFFYDDYEKIQLVLGDNQKEYPINKFINKKENIGSLFGTVDINYSEFYEINKEAFMRIDAYEYF